MKKKVIYKDPILNEPLPMKSFGEMMGDEEQIEKIIEIRSKKVFALMKHYGIPTGKENSGIRLALALVEDWVPAFQREKSKGGAPTKKNLYTESKLYVAVMELVDKGKSESNVCGILSKNKKSEYSGIKGTTLLRRFKKFQVEIKNIGVSKEQVINFIKR